MSRAKAATKSNIRFIVSAFHAFLYDAFVSLHAGEVIASGQVEHRRSRPEKRFNFGRNEVMSQDNQINARKCLHTPAEQFRQVREMAIDEGLIFAHQPVDFDAGIKNA